MTYRNLKLSLLACQPPRTNRSELLPATFHATCQTAGSKQRACSLIAKKPSFTQLRPTRPQDRALLLLSLPLCPSLVFGISQQSTSLKWRNKRRFGSNRTIFTATIHFGSSFLLAHDEKNGTRAGAKVHFTVPLSLTRAAAPHSFHRVLPTSPFCRGSQTRRTPCRPRMVRLAEPDLRAPSSRLVFHRRMRQNPF
jgi:hypothetical protein